MTKFRPGLRVPHLNSSPPPIPRPSLPSLVGWSPPARRSPDCDVSSAWEALCAATCPADIAKPAAAGGGGGGGRRAVQVPGVGGLVAAREGLKAEMEAVGRTAPRFNADRSLALLPISSGWQVHPLLPNRYVMTRATRRGGGMGYTLLYVLVSYCDRAGER